MSIKELLKPLKDWSDWACNEKQIPSADRASKAFDLIVIKQSQHVVAEGYDYYNFKDSKSAIPWRILCSVSKTMLLMKGTDSEGEMITSVVAKCLDDNASAFHAAILYSCTGYEVAEDILKESK